MMRCQSQSSSTAPTTHRQLMCCSSSLVPVSLSCLFEPTVYFLIDLKVYNCEISLINLFMYGKSKLSGLICWSLKCQFIGTWITVVQYRLQKHHAFTGDIHMPLWNVSLVVEERHTMIISCDVEASVWTEWINGEVQHLSKYSKYYTVFQKKHVTTFSMIIWSRTIRLQRFLAHLLPRV